MKRVLISVLLEVVTIFYGFPANAISDAYQQYLDNRKSKADAGDSKAEASLGTAYSMGRDLPQNDAEAVKWWRKAAEQGDVRGETMLGTAYMGGKGVIADKVEAAKWFRKAAEQGDPTGKAMFGQVSYLGIGVPQDKPLGMKLMRQAAEQGDPLAMSFLRMHHIPVKVTVGE